MAKRTPAWSTTVLAVFVAASVAGGYIKLPPLGSIALDSLPGYFVAGYYGVALGGVVGLLGHLASAATGGFPLGPLHLVVALEMFVWCGVFGFLIRTMDRTWAVWVSATVATLLNGVAGPLILVLFGLPLSLAKTLLPFLLGASALNVGLASVAILVLARLKVSDV